MPVRDNRNCVSARFKFQRAERRLADVIAIDRNDRIDRRIGDDRYFTGKLAHRYLYLATRRVIHGKRLIYIVVTLFSDMNGV